jgi:hypothetical protein
VLTFILVVVLGGGVGLLVVSLAESEKPATDAGPRRRAPDPSTAPEHHDSVEPDAPVDEAPPPVPEPEPQPDPEPEAELVPEVWVDPAPEREPVFAPWRPAAAEGPVRRRSAGAVPAAFVAVEGSYADVARAPVWRRLFAVIAILAIAVIGGVAVAAILAAVIGAAAEVLGNTIG